MERFLALPRFAFTPVYVDYAPDSPGVYGLFDGDELIYVGTALNGISIRDCLRRHLRGECTKAASHYAWELAVSPGAREAQILSAYENRAGRPPRCQAKAA